MGFSSVLLAFSRLCLAIWLSHPILRAAFDELEGVENRIGLVDSTTNRPIDGYTAEVWQPITGDYLDTAIRTCHSAAL